MLESICRIAIALNQAIEFSHSVPFTLPSSSTSKSSAHAKTMDAQCKRIIFLRVQCPFPHCSNRQAVSSSREVEAGPLQVATDDVLERVASMEAEWREEEIQTHTLQQPQQQTHNNNNNLMRLVQGTVLPQVQINHTHH